MNRLLFLSAVVMVTVLRAANLAPYEFYSYLGDDTDDPKLNYSKVVEPGRTGEANATYVVIGVPDVPSYRAIDGGFDGDLVIPAYIDGLPVRKINEAAFLECNRLRSIKLPATLREIGARAFADCLQLTNITFESGLSRVGESAFSNCTMLASIRFPKTLSRLGAGCFQGCISLSDVYFAGNAPRLMIPMVTNKSVLGESIFRTYGYYERFKVHINRNTYGWISPYERGVPEKWPVDFGYLQAHETVAEDGDEPSSASGFVTVITEIKGGAVAVPESWSTQYSEYAAKFGADFTASLVRPTGKKDSLGNDLVVWQDYVAGTDPTNPDDRFSASITMNGDVPVITPVPELSAVEQAKRKYTIWGKERLADSSWTEVAPGREGDYNFFKLSVEMRHE